jgi:hypothetical protein
LNFRELTGADLNTLVMMIIDRMGKQGNLPIVYDRTTKQLKEAGGASIPQTAGGGGTSVLIELVPPDYDIIIDESTNTVTYFGKAEPGTPLSSALWQIRRIDTSGDTTITYAGGVDSFTKVWDNRLTYSY